MSKIVITKTTNTIFFIILLVGGTFVTIFQSSFIIEVQAQTAESEYGYDDNNYNSEYPQEYGYDKKYYTPKDPPADIIVPIDFDTIQ